MHEFALLMDLASGKPLPASAMESPLLPEHTSLGSGVDPLPRLVR